MLMWGPGGAHRPADLRQPAGDAGQRAEFPQRPVVLMRIVAAVVLAVV